MTPVTTFLSYNPTGLSGHKCDWLNSLCETVKVTYVAIQEHFRKSKTIDKFFKDQFGLYNSYVIPGYRETGQNRGRPIAGIAQLSKSDVAVRKDRVMSNSKRIQAQVLNFPSSRLLWINAYLPTDPRTIVFDETELLAVLGDIEAVLDNTHYDDVLISGDMNWDMSRQSGFSVIMRRFLDRLNLQSVWETHPIDFTHIHTDDKAVSTLDHFICNARLLQFVADCGPLHFGDNPSRHSPIVLKLNLGLLPVKTKSNPVRPKRPAWYKASEEQAKNYTEALREKLRTLPVPDCLECHDVKCASARHSEERDGYVLDLLGAMIESSHDTIPMVGGGQGRAKPDSGCMPGWKEQVAPQREAAIFWHSIWLSAGRPNAGQLFEIRKRTRSQFQYAVRRVRKAADSIKSQKLFEASLWGGGDLLDELRKTRGGRHTPDLPETVAGANGEEEICQKFRQVYHDLYNSSNTSEDMISIKARVETNIQNEGLTEVLKISSASVKAAAVLMKRGKADVSGSYSSDAVRHAPDSFYEQLALVFRSFLVHGTVARPLLACAFMPLLKSSLKDPADTKSYRAIAGSSTILMLFDRVVLNLWGDRLASGSLQMGYKRGSSTAQCTYVVQETINHFLDGGSNPIMVALDMTMAFDMCRFSILFSKVEAKLPAVVTRVLIFVYERQYAWVRWGTYKSSEFGIVNGTRQGSVLSPALFTVYIQELLDKLRELGTGCHIGATFLGAVAWADDVLLTAPTRGSMQSMLDACSVFAAKVGLQFSTDPNPAKSKSKAVFVVGRRTDLEKPAPLLLCGKALPYVAHATHLGHELHENGTMTMDANMRRGAFIGKCMEVQEAFSFAAPAEVLGAVKLYCGDLYGGMLARLDSPEAQRLMNCWGTCVKDVWGLDRATHKVYARWLGSGHSTIKEDLLSRWPKFFRSLLTGPSPEAAVLARVAAADRRTATAANNALILSATGLSAWTATGDQVRAELRSREPAMTDDEMATAEMLLEALQQRAYLHTQCADTTVITAQIHLLSTG